MEEDAVTIVLRRLPVSGQIKSRGILEVFSGEITRGAVRSARRL